ncbi:MAG: DUF262 domain-containing protein [Pseudomonadota bacterium]
MDGLVAKFRMAQESLVVQQSDFSLSAISEMVTAGSIDIEPKYQRRHRWLDGRQSSLIESFILNVPVPPVYLSEDEYGEYSVIDGKQRITSIKRFICNELVLEGLNRLSELNGKRFDDLPVQIKNALSVRPYIRVITLLKQSNPQLKYEVFLRLNTGGESLTPQEIRNVAYSGSLNALLLELSENVVVREKLKISSESSNAYRKMEDVELVLRYFTLLQGWQSIGNVLADEMNNYMEKNRDASEAEINSLRQAFMGSINRCVSIFGVHAFHRPLERNNWREQLISPLFDAQMVSVSTITDEETARLANHPERVEAGLRELFENPDFAKAVSQATNNPANVKKRITDIRGLLQLLLREA